MYIALEQMLDDRVITPTLVSISIAFLVRAGGETKRRVSLVTAIFPVPVKGIKRAKVSVSMFALTV